MFESTFENTLNLKIVAANLTDKQIKSLKRGGHDPKKGMLRITKPFIIKGNPLLFWRKRLKGMAWVKLVKVKNISHQQKKMNEKELREFRDRLNVPINDEEIVETPFFRPESNSDAAKYLLNCRNQLKGFLPERKEQIQSIPLPSNIDKHLAGSMVVSYQPPWHLFGI